MDVQFIARLQTIRAYHRLERSLHQLHVIRQRLADIEKRYNFTKKAGKVSDVYQCKLKMSVTVGVYEMYKSYAKQQAKTLIRLRTQCGVYETLMRRNTSHTDDNSEHEGDQYDFIEEFILDTLEEDE